MQVKILVWTLPLVSSLALAGEPPTDAPAAPQPATAPAPAETASSGAARGTTDQATPRATDPAKSTSTDAMSSSSTTEQTQEPKLVEGSGAFHAPPGYREVQKGSTTMYCKQSMSVGSRVPVQTCYTAEQLREIEKQGESARQMLQQSVRAGALNVPPPPTDTIK